MEKSEAEDCCTVELVLVEAGTFHFLQPRSMEHSTGENVHYHGCLSVVGIVGPGRAELGAQVT